MIDWKDIWIRKGNLETKNLKLLNGYEKTTIDPKIVSLNISKVLKINKNTRVLEIGCGAGMVAEHLDCQYVGIDYSHTLVEKHKRILKNDVYTCEANKVFFEDKSFDCVFAYSIFQYFPNIEYANEVISEMSRIATKKIFIGDLPRTSHEENHLTYNEEMFSNWIKTEGYYNPHRFNAFLDVA
jgi:ubiquinone/menaquinone biosynthesis C-methylase UbiE